MADLALDTNGDLEIEDGEARIAEGDDALVQHLQMRMRFFRGEWFLDPRVGMPYYESVLVKNPDLVAVRGFFRQAILTTPGISGIDAFELLFDAARRILTVDFRARKDDGGILDFSREFVISA